MNRVFNHFKHINMKKINDYNQAMIDTEKFYNEEVNLRRTNSSKKSYLTRQQRNIADHLEQLREAYRHPARMLYGENVSLHDIKIAKGELLIIIKLYKSIN